MRTWARRAVELLPLAGIFFWHLLWLRDPEPPGPHWVSGLAVLLAIVLGAKTVYGWRREDAAHAHKPQVDLP